MFYSGLVKLGSSDFRGYLSMVQVWDRVLSAADVANILTGTVNNNLNMAPFMNGLLLDWAWGSYSSAAGITRYVLLSFS